MAQRIRVQTDAAGNHYLDYLEHNYQAVDALLALRDRWEAE